LTMKKADFEFIELLFTAILLLLMFVFYIKNFLKLKRNRKVEEIRNIIYWTGILLTILGFLYFIYILLTMGL